MNKILLLLSLIFTSAVLGQTDLSLVRGVISSEGSPLKGATILVKGTFNESISDEQGAFSIKASADDVLIINYFGMLEKEMAVSEEMKIDLKLDGELLDQVLIKGKKNKKEKEVVETAFGYKEKAAITYSVSDEKTSEDVKPYHTTLGHVLAGMSGIVVEGDINDVTAKFKFRKTMRLSFSLPTYPAIVFDGVIFDQSAQITPYVDVQQIASITLLKSPAATVKYGQFAAFGAIVINTKNYVQSRKKDVVAKPSALVKGNDYTESTVILEQFDGAKSDYIVGLEQSQTFKEAKALYEHEREKASNMTIPFYIEVSDYFLRWDEDYAFEVLSRIGAIASNNPKALKAYAYKLEERGKLRAARNVYKRILGLRPGYAQSYRDMAQISQSVGDYETAFALYYQIVYNTIPNVDCTGIQDVALNELRHLLAFHKSKVQYDALPNEMLKVGFKNDIRIVFEWTESATDFELQFVSPQKKYFRWNHTKFDSNELLKDEAKNGYAIKEYIIDDPDSGQWLVNLKYLGDPPNNNPTFLKYTLYKNYGLPNEEKTVKTVKLFKYSEKVMLDSFLY